MPSVFEKSLTRSANKRTWQRIAGMAEARELGCLKSGADSQPCGRRCGRRVFCDDSEWACAPTSDVSKVLQSLNRAPSFCKRKNRALGRLVARGHLTPEAAALWFRKNTEAAARELEHKQNEEDGHATRRCPKSGPVPRAGLSQEWACPKSGLVQNILGLSQEWACPKRHLRWVFTALFFLGIGNYSSQAKSNAHP